MVFCAWKLSHTAFMFSKSNNSRDFLQSFCRHGVFGLTIGGIVWFVVVVLFGAPLYQYVCNQPLEVRKHTSLLFFCRLLDRSLLLSLLLAAFTTFPLSIHFGPNVSMWIQIVLNLGWKDKMYTLTTWNKASKKEKYQIFLQAYSTASCVGAVVGTYVGAFPIPLDWDRPWQVMLALYLIKCAQHVINNS